MSVHQEISTTSSVLPSSKLMFVELVIEGGSRPLRALVDTGASSNFIRVQAVHELSLFSLVKSLDSSLLVRMANGTSITIPKQIIDLTYTVNGYEGSDSFFLLNMDERFDVILGMAWLIRHDPVIDWANQSIISFKSQLDVDKPSINEDVINLSKSILVSDDANCNQTTLLSDSQKFDVDPVCDGPASTSFSDSVPVCVCSSDSVPVRTSNRFSVLSESEPCCEDNYVVERTRLTSADIQSKGFSASKQKSRRTKRRRLLRRSAESGTPDQGLSSETLNALVVGSDGEAVQPITIENPPSQVDALTSLPVLHPRTFLKQLRRGEFEQVCFIVPDNDSSFETLSVSSTVDLSVDPKNKAELGSQTWESAMHDALQSPVGDVIAQFSDLFPEKVPSELPKDRGIRHEIDLAPGTKYCVTRQWPLPRDQVEAIDEFFKSRALAGQVRESKSPHCSPTFCVKKATGGWRIVHAFNRLNDATIPAQTPIPRKDMILDAMQGSVLFSTLDLMDGFYQILMRESDIPLTAVSTPSGMLWEWLVMPQGLKNAPATFNRMVSHILRPFREFAPSYFDDIFVHSKPEPGRSALDVHKEHLHKVFTAMRESKLFANIRKCIFAALEIPVLGCIVGRNGVRPDPDKVKTIAEWPIPQNVKQLRQWLGLANYLHKYTKNYAALVQPLTKLLRTENEFIWTNEQQSAFDSVKASLQSAPILALPDFSKTFHVVCDASKFAIGCALMQHDDEGHERVVSYQSRQLKPAERNYPVHDKELLAMKYALVKFRVYLMGGKTFAIYTDHASLRTATKSPHLSQRMARWLSFFSEYNFVVHYKPGKSNILADALSRRPDYDSQDSVVSSHETDCRFCSSAQLNAVRAERPISPLIEEIKSAYTGDPDCKALLDHFSDNNQRTIDKLSARLRSRLHRFSFRDGLLYYAVHPTEPPRILVPLNDVLRTRILVEYHDCPAGGHLGREKTYLAVSRDFYWSHLYKWVRKYVRTCDMCQRVKPTPSSQAPLRSLQIPEACWQSVSMDFVFGLPPDKHGNTGLLVFVDRFSKMVHLAAVKASVNAKESARLFVELVFRHHGMPRELVTDRDPRFTSCFWRAVFAAVGTRLAMSTAAHPETDGQTERANRVVEDVLRSFAQSFPTWSSFLPMVEFAINNSVHASTGHTPFFINYGRHPTLPGLLTGDVATLSGGGSPPSSHNLTENSVLPPTVQASLNAIDANDDSFQAHFDELPDIRSASKSELKSINDFLLQKQLTLRFVRDALANAVDKQKENADRHGRKNMNSFKVNDKVLLSTANLPTHALSVDMHNKKLRHRFIGPFKVVKKHGDAYTLDLPKKMRLHPTFYVGRLKAYHSSLLEQTLDPSTLTPDQRSLSPLPDTSGLEQSSGPIQTLPIAPGIDAMNSPRSSESSIRFSDRPPPRPLVDSHGDQRWIVDSIVDHRFLSREGLDKVRDTNGYLHMDRLPLGRLKKQSDTDNNICVYRIRWLGFQSSDDTWDTHDRIVEDVPDIVREYRQSNFP